MKIITVNGKGQVTIPADIRRRLRIVRGTRLGIYESGNTIILRPLQKEQTRAARRFMKRGKASIDAFLRDCREDRI